MLLQALRTNVAFYETTICTLFSCTEATTERNPHALAPHIEENVPAVRLTGRPIGSKHILNFRRLVA